MLRFTGAAASDRGRVRDHNEDSAYAGPGLLVVADGVGGAAAGEVASATAVYVLSALALQGAYADPLAALRSGVRLAQEQVALGVRLDDRRAGMATTLTAVLGDGRRFALAHLGDSRAYVHREGELVRVTRDHTFVQDLLDDGRLSEREAGTHPWRHVVTRSLGGDPGETGDLTWLDLRRGDRVLVCSDGLTDMVADGEIARLLREHRSDDAAVTALVGAANAAGGRDNVTCVLATVVPGVPQSNEGVLVGAGRDPRLVVDAAAVHVRRSA